MTSKIEIVANLISNQYNTKVFIFDDNYIMVKKSDGTGFSFPYHTFMDWKTITKILNQNLNNNNDCDICYTTITDSKATCGACGNGWCASCNNKINKCPFCRIIPRGVIA